MSTEACKWLAQHGHGVFVPAVARAGVDMATLSRMSSWDLDRMGVPPGLHRTAMLIDLQHWESPSVIVEHPAPQYMTPWSPPERDTEEDEPRIRSPVVDCRMPPRHGRSTPRSQSHGSSLNKHPLTVPYRFGTDPNYDNFGSRVSRPRDQMKVPGSFQKKDFVDLTIGTEDASQKHTVAFRPGGDDIVEHISSARLADIRPLTTETSPVKLSVASASQTDGGDFGNPRQTGATVVSEETQTIESKGTQTDSSKQTQTEPKQTIGTVPTKERVDDLNAILEKARRSVKSRYAQVDKQRLRPSSQAPQRRESVYSQGEQMLTEPLQHDVAMQINRGRSNLPSHQLPLNREGAILRIDQGQSDLYSPDSNVSHGRNRRQSMYSPDDEQLTQATLDRARREAAMQRAPGVKVDIQTIDVPMYEPHNHANMGAGGATMNQVLVPVAVPQANSVSPTGRRKSMYAPGDEELTHQSIHRAAVEMRPLWSREVSTPLTNLQDTAAQVAFEDRLRGLAIFDTELGGVDPANVPPRHALGRLLANIKNNPELRNALMRADPAELEYFFIKHDKFVAKLKAKKRKKRKANKEVDNSDLSDSPHFVQRKSALKKPSTFNLTPEFVTEIPDEFCDDDEIGNSEMFRPSVNFHDSDSDEGMAELDRMADAAPRFQGMANAGVTPGARVYEELNIQIYRSNAQPWGMRVFGGVDIAKKQGRPVHQPLVVSDTTQDSITDGKLFNGDQILMINNEDMTRKTHNEAIMALQSAQGATVFTILRKRGAGQSFRFRNVEIEDEEDIEASVLIPSNQSSLVNSPPKIEEIVTPDTTSETALVSQKIDRYHEEPFGFMFVGPEADYPKAVITSSTTGSICEGKLLAYDELVQVNDQDISQFSTHDKLRQFLRSLYGEVNFVVRRSKSGVDVRPSSSSARSKKYIVHVELHRKSITESYGMGIGTTSSGNAVVTHVETGTAADEAVQIEDHILAVDGNNVGHMRTSDIAKLFGTVHTSIILTLEREVKPIPLNRGLTLSRLRPDLSITNRKDHLGKVDIPNRIDVMEVEITRPSPSVKFGFGAATTASGKKVAHTIDADSPAYGKLQENDFLHIINGKDAESMTHDELVQEVNSTLNLKITLHRGVLKEANIQSTVDTRLEAARSNPIGDSTIIEPVDGLDEEPVIDSNSAMGSDADDSDTPMDVSMSITNRNFEPLAQSDYATEEDSCNNTSVHDSTAIVSSDVSQISSQSFSAEPQTETDSQIKLQQKSSKRMSSPKQRKSTKRSKKLVGRSEHAYDTGESGDKGLFWNEEELQEPVSPIPTPPTGVPIAHGTAVEQVFCQNSVVHEPDSPQYATPQGASLVGDDGYAYPQDASVPSNVEVVQSGVNGSKLESHSESAAAFGSAGAALTAGFADLDDSTVSLDERPRSLVDNNAFESAGALVGNEFDNLDYSTDIEGARDPPALSEISTTPPSLVRKLQPSEMSITIHRVPSTPFNFKFRGGEVEKIVVSEIFYGSIVEGKLKDRDEIVQVNDYELRGLTREQVKAILEASFGEVKFIIRRGAQGPQGGRRRSSYAVAPSLSTEPQIAVQNKGSATDSMRLTNLEAELQQQDRRISVNDGIAFVDQSTYAQDEPVMLNTSRLSVYHEEDEVEEQLEEV